MPRFLLATLPITGHVQPVKLVARRLVERGHDVGWYTGSQFRALVEATGARYFGPKHALDFDERHIDATFQRNKNLRGHAAFQDDVLRILVQSARGQVLDLHEILATFSPDALLSELTFAGAWVIAGQRNLRWAVLGVSALPLASIDTAPFGTGIPPSSTGLGRLRNRMLRALARRLVTRKLQARANRELESFGLPELEHTVLDAAVLGCNLYLQATAPAFEYPRSDMAKHVQFIGPLLPEPPERVELPGWWRELRGTRPVVHVTQGTLANDHQELLIPTLRALADEDVTVVATTGGRDLSVAIPRNARVERFLPYHALMPLVSAMVTNAGYGGVQFALAHGVPLVAAGQTEEKAEISARIAWSGAGIDLKTSRPSVDAIRRTVRRVLSEPAFRACAASLRTEFSKYDAADAASGALEELTERSDAGAQARLGSTSQRGPGAPQDGAEALKWYRKAAEQGHAKAQTGLGRMYQTGQGVARDDAAAVTWYRRAAEQDDARAQTNLGSMYEKGRGVPRDHAEALKWYRKAAEQGHVKALTSLGRMYQTGQGVARDAAAAMSWYRRAAEHDDAGAQTSLGSMLQEGRGVPRDDAEAVRWYRRAAENGHARAQTKLGWMYQEGRGVPQDDAEAVRWYRRAAENGHARAQASLGWMYQKGRGVPRDDAEALRWYRRAASQGNSWAQRILQGRGLDWTVEAGVQAGGPASGATATDDDPPGAAR